ncbi:MAG: CopD family protein [Rhodospirillales bacterium]|nr:CopD family protein [Rhodospirillales bacterium]
MSATLIARGLARGLHVAASFAVFGSLLCHAWFAPAALPHVAPETARRVGRLVTACIRLSLVAAAVTGAVWLLLEAVYITGGGRLTDGLAVLAPILHETNFGHLLLTRMALLLVAVMLFDDGSRRRGTATAAIIAGVAVVLEAGLGHGPAMGGGEGVIMSVSLVLHLLASGAWLGTLIPLLILIDALPPADARDLASRFSTLGTICVLVLATTAAIQGWDLVGGIAALFGTPYGRVAFAKLLLFITLLAFAAANRFRFTPTLIGSGARRAATGLRWSILAETLIGLFVVVLAGILANLPPNMIMRTGP